MKGIIMTLVLAFIVWGFWMSYEWLRNRKKNDKLKKNQEEK